MRVLACTQGCDSEPMPLAAAVGWAMRRMLAVGETCNEGTKGKKWEGVDIKHDGRDRASLAASEHRLLITENVPMSYLWSGPVLSATFSLSLSLCLRHATTVRHYGNGTTQLRNHATSFVGHAAVRDGAIGSSVLVHVK